MKSIIIFLTLICLTGGFTYYKLNHRLYSCETVVDLSKPHYQIGSVTRVMMTCVFGEPDLTKYFEGDVFIKRAIGHYNLETLFQMNATELEELISKSVELEQIENSDLLSITTLAKTENTAQKLNCAIVKSYQSAREESLRMRALEAISIFTEKIKLQEDRVGDHKTRLDGLAKKYGFTYISPDLEGVVSETIVTDDKERLKELPEKITMLGLTEERRRFEKVAEDYERELVILKAIKEAKHNELKIDKSTDRYSFLLHKIGWFPEIEMMMKARKEGK